MRMEYSEDGQDWSPMADSYDMNAKSITKSLIPYIFRGEYEIFNQFDGPLVDLMKQYDDGIYYVFNGIWDLYGQSPLLQINCSNKHDEVIFRLAVWF